MVMVEVAVVVAEEEKTVPELSRISLELVLVAMVTAESSARPV